MKYSYRWYKNRWNGGTVGVTTTVSETKKLFEPWSMLLRHRWLKLSQWPGLSFIHPRARLRAVSWKFFFRFSEGVHHETRETRAALPSPAFSHAHGHFGVSRVCSTEKEKRDAARSLSLFLIFEVFFYPSCYRSEVASWLSTQNTLQRMATDMTGYTR